MRSISTNVKITCFFAFIFAFVFSPGPARADWQKMDPPPDVDKSAHGHTAEMSCWMATAANMLAGAGYGTGSTVQARSDNIYSWLVATCKAKNNNQIVAGWTDTALNWYLGSQPIYTSNPYRVPTVLGYKSYTPWANPSLPQDIGNELRRCAMLGVDIFWYSQKIGHAITAWGDNGDAGNLTTNPTQLKVTDSDKDFLGDVQTYIYDSYANGWEFNYQLTNHPAIRHIVVLWAIDINEPNIATLTQPFKGSYTIVQNNSSQNAKGLHYEVSSSLYPTGDGKATIYSYLTTIDWQTSNPPTIVESSPRTSITVDWDLSDNPVPGNTWVKIDAQLITPALPVGNLSHYVRYSNVHFTYSPNGPPKPAFELAMGRSAIADTNNIPNICGGYVVGSFDFFDDAVGTELVGRYRFQHEYDYFQDPEFHEFSLEAVEEPCLPMYYVGNFQFGHSYGLLDDESIWQFDDWMTEEPNILSFGEGDFVEFTLDWDGRLPYPQGDNYIAPDPNNCGDPGTVYLPEDLNQDCYIDFRDFAYFAGRWLQCTEPNNPNCDPYWK